MDINKKVDAYLVQFDVESGKCSSDRSIFSPYIPDLGFLVHALQPEVCCEMS